MGISALQDQFGAIDIYLFDQLLRGRIVRGMRVLDAGCGSGRNLVYLLQNGFDVSAVDRDPRAVAEVCQLAAALAPHIPPVAIPRRARGSLLVSRRLLRRGAQ